jgi:hypothetical protein
MGDGERFHFGNILHSRTPHSHSSLFTVPYYSSLSLILRTILSHERAAVKGLGLLGWVCSCKQYRGLVHIKPV